MKCKYTKHLFALLLIGAIFCIYKIFFSNNIVDDHGHLHHQAHIALHNEEYERTIKLCDQAIQTDASSTNLYLMHAKKATALNKLQRYKEAIDSADLAITIYPKKEEAYLAKVDALFNLGREEELTAILEEIESINPHTPLKPLLNSLRQERGKAQY